MVRFLKVLSILILFSTFLFFTLVYGRIHVEPPNGEGNVSTQDRDKPGKNINGSTENTRSPGNNGAGSDNNSDAGQGANSSAGSGNNSDAGLGGNGSTGSSNNSNIDPGDNGNNGGEINYSVIKPNEAGKIMVVMFHNFVESFSPAKNNKGEYTTTFASFRKLLKDLYDRDYRLISLDDYLNNYITVPAGKIPMVFTFDDATKGQYNLVTENGKLAVNKLSAVGIMKEFYKKHPDFGLEGTFYVNLADPTFPGEGTLVDRLGYLISKGFEIGNHTLHHVHLNEIKSSEKLQMEIGGNQKKMHELFPGYLMNSLSLPYGQPARELAQYVITGEYEGTKYKNAAILKVGWDPAPSPAVIKFNPHSLPRVRAPGITPVDGDLCWWLASLPRSAQYISDGDPDTVTVPESRRKDIDSGRLNKKRLVTY